MKTDVMLGFVLLLVLVLVVYYVGTASLVLTGASVLQQLGYFLTGRTSSGKYGYTTVTGPGNTDTFRQQYAQWLAQQLGGQ